MCWFFFFENREYNQKPLLLSSQKLAFHQLYFFQFPSFSRISTTRFLLFLVSAYHKLCFSVVWSLFLIQVVEFSPLFALCPQTISLFFPQNSSQQNYFEELFESTKSGKSKCKIVKY